MTSIKNAKPKKLVVTKKKARNKVISKKVKKTIKKDTVETINEIEEIENDLLLLNLKQATLKLPFDSLGIFKDRKDNGFIVRAWVPEAFDLELYFLGEKKSAGKFTLIDKSGLFEIYLPDLIDKKIYELNAIYEKATNRFIDPYQFHNIAFEGLETLGEAPENIYKTLGAQLKTVDLYGEKISGIRFIVYAPNASSVSLITELNQWDGQRQPMQNSWCGHWVLFVPEMKIGTKYKYELKDALGNRLPHKADPVGFQADQFPSHASVVVDPKSYQWNDTSWMQKENTDKRFSPMSIYEVHLGSWRRKSENGIERMLTYYELADELTSYISSMGYTHIEIMPISEFPFDGSWGYQPVGLFAPTSRFGDPDGFKFLVDKCHQENIGVIIDWVPAHFPADPHGLARFDGTPLYEYEDPRRGWHPDWNSYIYDFGRDNVRQFLIASALIWLDHYHIDGLRVDAVASMLYWDYSRDDGEWVPNVDGGNHNYEAISLLKWFNEKVYKDYPNAMTIAEESTAFTGVSKPTFEGGLGFGFKWNMGWMHDTLEYMQKDPAYRKFHHHKMTFAMIYHYNEHFILPISHDEVVHGKRCLLGKMPGDEWQAAANLRAYMGYMYAHPGKKLNFMGCEFAQTKEWDHNISLDWHLLEYEKHQGHKLLIKDLNHIYKSHTELFDADYNEQGFQWIECNDDENSVVSFIRSDRAQDHKLISVSNFTPIPRDNYRLGVPMEGEYEVILNTDSCYYWGSNYNLGNQFKSFNSPHQGQPYSIELNLPPLSTIYLQKKEI